MKALHEAVFVFSLFTSGYFKKVNLLDYGKAWWNWKIMIIKVDLVILLVDSLFVVIHHHDVHSSEQPGMKTLKIWICLHLSEY